MGRRNSHLRSRLNRHNGHGGKHISANDPKERTLTWIETYLDTANILKVDDATPCTVHTAFGNPTYPLKLVFFGEIGSDCELAIMDPESDALVAANKSAYAYNEKVPIEIYAVDKYDSGTLTVSGTDVLWQAEQELRRIQEEYPLGSIRTFQSFQPKSQNMGGWTLYSKRCILGYKRASANYSCGVTLTWGDSETPEDTYVFPNVVEIHFTDPDSGDAKLMPPSRIGNITQILGMEDFEITLICDLDIEPDALSWKRPQETSPKEDDVDWEIFEEVKFGGKTDADQIYQTLDLDWGGTLPVRVTNVTVIPTGDGRKLELTLRRYSAASGSEGTYKAWYGYST